MLCGEDRDSKERTCDNGEFVKRSEGDGVEGREGCGFVASSLQVCCDVWRRAPDPACNRASSVPKVISGTNLALPNRSFSGTHSRTRSSRHSRSPSTIRGESQGPVTPLTSLPSDVTTLILSNPKKAGS